MPGTGRDLPRSRAPTRPSGRSKETLVFIIELDEGGKRQRIIARAGSATLARVIFDAACAEFPGHSVVLRNGDEIIASRLF